MKKIETFGERVLRCALAIPFGKVTTYGNIAKAAGAHPMASQSVTRILAKAYERGETKIPFHRIVYAGGKVWLSDTYAKKRKELYAKEGIEIDRNGKILNFEEHFFKFL